MISSVVTEDQSATLRLSSDRGSLFRSDRKDAI